MADIVERLRSFGPDWTSRETGMIVPYEVCVLAADEIVHLRSALKEISALGDVRADEAATIARHALAGTR